jgi:hypothetical protein
MILPTSYLNLLMEFDLNYIKDGYSNLEGAANAVQNYLETKLLNDEIWNKYNVKAEKTREKINLFKAEVGENLGFLKESIENFIMANAKICPAEKERIKREIPYQSCGYS